MIYGFIGWFWETPYVSIRQRKYVNRGFLNGPFIPIYGFGALFMILSEGFLRPILPTNDILQFLVLMLYAAVMSSILEYATSYVLEQAFHTRWWDYSEKRFHLKGRICLSYSICWGFVGFGIIKWIHPVVTNLISSIPLKFGIIVVIVYCIIFSLDVIVTFKDLISLKSVMAELLVLTTELKDKVVEGFSVQKEKLSDSIETKQVKIKEEILHMKAQGEAVISEKQDSLMKNYNLLLEKSKRYSRFYYAFPKASSNKFRDLIDVVRKNIKR
jgi:uncharacterized membrane protein